MADLVLEMLPAQVPDHHLSGRSSLGAEMATENAGEVDVSRTMGNLSLEITKKTMIFEIKFRFQTFLNYRITLISYLPKLY